MISSDKPSINKQQPTPLYIIHNTKQITFILFSKLSQQQNDGVLYVGTRDGYFYVYDLEIRRPIFKLNLNNQSITNVIEISEIELLIYCRDGSLFRLNALSNTEWKHQCELSMYNFKITTIFNRYFRALRRL